MSCTERRFKTSNENPKVELALPLPPNIELYREYDEVYFHLMQTPGLGTAMRETYGENNMHSARRLSKFLSETTDQSYINLVGERLFSQQTSITLKAELLSLYGGNQANILGCIFFASLLPKYCKWFRTLHGQMSDMSGSGRDEDEIVQSFIAEIKSLRYPGLCWWLVIMRKYTELYQKLHGEDPKDFHLLWKEEDEMIAAEEAEIEARLNKFFGLEPCPFCNSLGRDGFCDSYRCMQSRGLVD